MKNARRNGLTSEKTTRGLVEGLTLAPHGAVASYRSARATLPYLRESRLVRLNGCRRLLTSRASLALLYGPIRSRFMKARVSCGNRLRIGLRY